MEGIAAGFGAVAAFRANSLHHHPTLEDDLNAARLAKEFDPEIVTVTKGAHFKDLDLETLDGHADLDVAMRGEYEETVVDLAQGKPWGEVAGITYRQNGKAVRTAERPFIADLDRIPFPARHLIDNSVYYRPDTGAIQATLVTERGCPYPCIFCLAGEVGGKRARVRSPENVLAEIRECVETHRISDFLFRSDLFTADRSGCGGCVRRFSMKTSKSIGPATAVWTRWMKRRWTS